MKFIPFLLLFISGSALSSAGQFSEELFVSDTSQLKLIQAHPDLIVDHISSHGFELYGPSGTAKWLKESGVSFSKMPKKTQKDMSALGYPSFEEVEANLKALVKKRPDIAKLISIGKSVQGKDLYVVKLSDNVDIDETEPEFKYISSMHGDEITGRELTQFLIKDMIEGYGKNQKITDLINNTEIYIMPSMNPDGSTLQQRGNAKGYDLNRNFPDWTRGDVNSAKTRQVETKALMAFQASRNFSLSANFHGGAVVVNYPWDNTHDLHPFDTMIKDISLLYADLNPTMRNSREFNRGIINGADWYVVKGGMQDWSYSWHNDLQVTIELSDKKWPRYSNIPSFYRDNKQSMLSYLTSVHQGAGFKIDNSKATGKVKVIQNLTNGTTADNGSYGFSRGEFYKVLPEGNYTFVVEIDGSSTTNTINVVVDKSIQTDGGFVKIKQ